MNEKTVSLYLKRGVNKKLDETIMAHEIDWDRKKIPVKYYEEVGPGVIVARETKIQAPLIGEGDRLFLVHVWD